LLQTDRVEAAWDLAVRGEDRLHLTGEVEAASVGQQVERANTRPVARQHQPTLRDVPQRDGKLPVEALERRLTPRFVGDSDHLCVTFRAELEASCLQLRPQLHVVEDLAVKDQPRRL